jgi:hypothetical protein
MFYYNGRAYSYTTYPLAKHAFTCVVLTIVRAMDEENYYNVLRVSLRMFSFTSIRPIESFSKYNIVR